MSKIAICLIVKDEEDAIVEWLLHYHLLGFDEAIIFDNRSSDRTAQMIEMASSFIRCRYIYWDFGRDTGNPQLRAYEHCIKHFGADFEWIAFFDIDEILIPQESNLSIKQYLIDQDVDVGLIGINWLLFGSGGVCGRPAQTMMELFIERGGLVYHANRNIKSILRPAHSNGECNNPHWFKVNGRSTRLDGKPLTWEATQEGVVALDDILQGQFRLHHYYTRGMEAWNKRMERGQCGGMKVGIELFASHDCNDIHDDSAVIFADRVKDLAYKLQIPLFASELM